MRIPTRCAPLLESQRSALCHIAELQLCVRLSSTSLAVRLPAPGWRSV